MKTFWLGFEKQAGFVHGGYAMNLMRSAQKTVSPVVSGAAQKAVSAAQAIGKPISALSRNSMQGSSLLRTTKNITEI